MPEAMGTETLGLAAEFAPASTAEWEAAIQKDLKGADYEKKLVWHVEEGMAVRPYYRRDALAQLGKLADLAPGEFPYTRGDSQTVENVQNWVAPADAIRADYLHEAGGTAVQELAFALAEAVEKLASAVDKEHRSVDATARTIAFVYAIGSNYFFEIAKLRAARMLWATAAAAFGLEGPESAMARIHARTARFNKSLLDPYTNLLRVTTEAATALIAGCDSLTVEPFGFDAHLALNVERVLREEAYLTRVLDPAGGSYYIETLTDALARTAWKLFQQVEEQGGWTAALSSGFIEKALTESRQDKAAALASRRQILVGVNHYPNLREKISDVSRPNCLPNDEFPQIRLAGPFEAIRQRTIAHAQRTGRYSKVLLLKRGELKMKMARANFCLNFFGCAGFDLVEAQEYAGSDADLIVLCSSDKEYLPFAREVCTNVAVPVLVAGNPKEQIADLKAAGVRGFVHTLSNALETLAYWQDELGMEALGNG